MSTYVLYNSLSGNGTGKTKAEEIKPFLSGKELVFEDVTKITDANAFFAGLNPDDELYLCGGDGTLNRFINNTDGIDIVQPLYFFPTGTGNDFWNDLGKKVGDAPVQINEYIKDNLVDKSKADAVLKAVDTLEISTIDILKSIIDEVNIHGDITEHSMLNIPKARYKIDVVRFHYLGKEKFGELKEFLKTKMPVGMTMKVWLNKEWRVNEDNERETNEEMIEEMFNMSCWTNQLASSTQYLVKGQQTFYGEVIEEVDENGFFVVHDNSTDEEELCRVLNYHNAPSLYRGALSSFIY